MTSDASNGAIDPSFHRDIKDQIQLLADEIAALSVIDENDPSNATTTRLIYLKQRTIGRLRIFLPTIPTNAASPDTAIQQDSRRRR